MRNNSEKRHILIFEPRVEGHHISYLVNVANDLLSFGCTVSVAIDGRNEVAKNRILQQDEQFFQKVIVFNPFTKAGRFKGGSKLGAAAINLQESQADEIFFNSLDEVISALLRKAAFGFFPPKELFGKISGIYVRPRPLDPSQSGLGNAWKAMGFNCLHKRGFFKHLFLLDEFLTPVVQQKYSNLKVTFLPELNLPWAIPSKEKGRAFLKLNTDKIVLLSYGIGSRRKGLHLVLDALDKFENHPYFLLVAGIQEDRATLERLKKLQLAGQALVLDRFVSNEEEAALFAATDIVLLPYIDHYGSSNVLAKAAFAEKPVLASDFHLIGKRVREHNLGWTFENGNVAHLYKCLRDLPDNSLNDLQALRASLNDYAKSCNRAVFAHALKEGMRE